MGRMGGGGLQEISLGTASGQFGAKSLFAEQRPVRAGVGPYEAEGPEASERPEIPRAEMSDVFVIVPDERGGGRQGTVDIPVPADDGHGLPERGETKHVLVGFGLARDDPVESVGGKFLEHRLRGQVGTVHNRHPPMAVLAGVAGNAREQIAAGGTGEAQDDGDVLNPFSRGGFGHASSIAQLPE